MKTLVFTAKKLLDVLSELERIEDGEMFRRYVFKIIHSEVMKASYLNVRHLETDTYDGNNILVSDLVLAGQQSQDQMLIFCCSCCIRIVIEKRFNWSITCINSCINFYSLTFKNITRENNIST